MSQIDTLRARMLEVAGAAREQHINRELDAYAISRGELEGILDRFRHLFRRDSTPFDEALLADIRTAKLCARIITGADLDREAAERARRAIVAAHGAFLDSRGLANRGTRLGLGQHRVTHCYRCKRSLESGVDVECSACGWIICSCGACGCGYGGAG